MKQVPKNRDILQFKIVNKARQAVKTENFRLYFKVIIRQNETQYFTEKENTVSSEAIDYLKLLSYIYIMEMFILTNKPSTDKEIQCT